MKLSTADISRPGARPRPCGGRPSCPLRGTHACAPQHAGPHMKRSRTAPEPRVGLPGGASSYQIPVHAGLPPEQADVGPHLSRAITGGSPTPRTYSRHRALAWTYALTLDQLGARGQLLRHVPCGTGTRRRRIPLSAVLPAAPQGPKHAKMSRRPPSVVAGPGVLALAGGCEKPRSGPLMGQRSHIRSNLRHRHRPETRKRRATSKRRTCWEHSATTPPPRSRAKSAHPYNHSRLVEFPQTDRPSTEFPHRSVTQPPARSASVRWSPKRR